MWTFDEVQYTKTVLNPAEKDFKKDQVLPDYFRRYDLLESAMQLDIETAIETVPKFWNKSKTNAKYTPLLNRLLDPAESGRACKTLRNEEERRAYLAELREWRERAARALLERAETSLRVVLAGKSYLTPEERAAFLERYTGGGVSQKELESFVDGILARLPPAPPPPPPLPEPLAPGVMELLGSSLAVLSKSNLWDFLGVRDIPAVSSTEWPNIEDAYRARIEEWAPRPSDNLKVAAQELLGLVNVHVLTDPRRYEAARLRQLADTELGPDTELAGRDREISAAEYRELVKHANAVGLDEEFARKYITGLAKENGWVVEVPAGAAEPVVRCADCYALNERIARHCTSPACGMPLWALCPRCRGEVARSQERCVCCGFDRRDAPKVERLKLQLRSAVDERRLMGAREIARELESIWSLEGDLKQLDKIAKEGRCYADDLYGQIRDAVVRRHLFAARDLLRDLRLRVTDYRGPDGKTAEELEAESVSHFKNIEILLERARRHELDRRTDEAITAVSQVLAIAKDCTEALNAAARMPPMPPSSAQATPQPDHILIEWTPSPSTGEIEYEVLRQGGAAAKSQPGGGRTKATSCEDRKLAPGATLFYTVFAWRLGARSAGIRTDSVLAAFEVSNFRLKPGDHEIRGTWTFSGSRTGIVKVFMGEGSPPEPPGGSLADLAGPTSFVDRKVENGKTYYYRVCVEYTAANGKVELTAGMVAHCQPTCPPPPPLPVEDLRVRIAGAAAVLEWSPPPQGIVDIYRLGEMPEWARGSLLAPGLIKSLGTPLQGSSGQPPALDTPPPDELACYLPVTRDGDLQVVGAPALFVPDVSGLKAENLDTQLLLSWCWPRDCTLARVAWRPDRNPDDPWDKRARTREIDRDTYDKRGGFRLDRPRCQPYRFTVFAAVLVGGKALFSSGTDPGCRADLRTAGWVRIRYRLERGAFLLGPHLNLTLYASKDVPALPDLVLVAKPGRDPPTDADDGTVLSTFGGVSLKAKKPAKFAVNLPAGVRKRASLRLFFRERQAYESFRLEGPPVAELWVK